MTTNDPMKLIQTLSNNLEILGALGALAAFRLIDGIPDETVLKKLNAVEQAYAPGFLDGQTEEELQFVYATIRANLNRAKSFVDAPDSGAGWAFDDPVILQTQGKGSRLVTKLISDFAAKNHDLKSLLLGKSEFLDIGCGAGWISISMAETWKGLSAHGIDIHQPALNLAELNRAQSTASDRVSFLNQNVTDISFEERFSSAFIPIIFLPEDIVVEVMPKVRDSLIHKGWIFVASFVLPDDPVDFALIDLRTTLFGGRIWKESEIASLLSEIGFSSIANIGTGTPINLIAAEK
jgi:SAM-dependent methyltransferase